MAIPDTEVERQIQQMIQFIDHEADEKEVEILAKVWIYHWICFFLS